MLLLMPLILIGVFGTMVFAGRARNIPELARPLLGLGVISITMLSFTQILCNLFGVDRDGFRAFVLSPVRRRDILLGKNLAIAPLGARRLLPGTGGLAGVAADGEFALPGHSGSAVHRVPVVLPDRQRRVHPRPVGGFRRVSQAGQGEDLDRADPPPGDLPVARDAACRGSSCLEASCLLDQVVDRVPGLDYRVLVPVYLVSVSSAPPCVWIYRRSLASQGRWLQSREQTILEVVTQRASR